MKKLQYITQEKKTITTSFFPTTVQPLSLVNDAQAFMMENMLDCRDFL